MYVKNYKGLDKNAFKEDIQNAPWWVCSISEDVDDVTYAGSTMYDGIVTEHIKKRKANIWTNSLPWVDSFILKLMNKRYKLLKQCNGTDKTTESWTEYRKVRNQVTTMMKKAETKYWQEQFKEATAAQEFWKVYRKATKKKINNRVSPLKSIEAETITNNTKKAELMNTFLLTSEKILHKTLLIVFKTKTVMYTK